MKALYTLLFISILAVPVLAGETETTTLDEGKHFLSSQQIAFEENKGQVTGDDGSKVKFTYQAGGLSIFLMRTGITYQFNKTHYPEGYTYPNKFATPEEQEEMDELAEKIRLETYRMDVTLLGANPNAKITSEGKSKDYIQYYNHNALDVHSFSKVTYHDIYPKIDWVIYKKGETIKYDFVVRPGGDPNQIKLKTTEVENINLDQDGNLTLTTSMGAVTENKPVSYQSGIEIPSEFQLNKEVISFKVDSYNIDEILIIDPVLAWATYYGGSSSDYGYSCSVDDSGNVYLAGTTYSGTGIALVGHQDTLGGYSDAFLVKFNAIGIRQWATYYGGVTMDLGVSCANDDSGNVYLAGRTLSTTGIAFGGHQNTTVGGITSFLVKFNATGTRLWATYYGGPGGDWCRFCTVDDSGNVYLAGETSSSYNIASNGFQNVHGGGGDDGFVVKFNSAGVRQWGSYYGGLGYELGYSCAVDDSGNVFFAGTTTSSTNIASAGHQDSIGGTIYNTDAFLVKFNSTGTRLWSTYYGGSGFEEGYSCAVDAFGNAYLAGETNSATNIASNGHQNALIGGIESFLVKFTSAGTRLWATYYGGLGGSVGNSCAVVDTYGNVFLTGNTGSSTGIASAGYQSTYGGSGDAFLVKFNPAGLRQWGTYHGGSGSETGASCAINNSGTVCFAGASSSLTNVASGGYQNALSGSGDAFLVKVCRDSIIDTQVACNSFTWINGVTYITSNNTAMYVATNTNGCDSVVTLNLTIYYPNTVSDTINACDSYTSISGTTWTTSGVYLDTLFNVGGCDSIVTLTLTVNNSTMYIDTQIACDSFTWINGVTYTTNNNTAKDTLINAAGCDSIVILNLILNNSTTYIDTQIACDSYTWIDGVTYTTSNNTAIDTLTNAAGCDSIVTLNLTINNSTTSIDLQTACDSYIWIDGLTYTASNNTATHVLINTAGCDSIVTLNLTINQSVTVTDTKIACNRYTSISGKTWEVSGVYQDTLTNVNGCDSIVTLNLIINSFDVSITVATNTISANLLGAAYQWLGCNGGYTVIPNETNFSYTATQSGNYAVEITMNGCVDTSSCTRLTNVSVTEPNFGSNFNVYPNPTSGKISISLGEVINNVSVKIFNSVGQIVAEPITHQNTDELEFEIMGERGVYFIQITTQEKTGLWKVVKD